jgi:hypothetical protein
MGKLLALFIFALALALVTGKDDSENLDRAMKLAERQREVARRYQGIVASLKRTRDGLLEPSEYKKLLLEYFTKDGVIESRFKNAIEEFILTVKDPVSPDELWTDISQGVLFQKLNQQKSFNKLREDM